MKRITTAQIRARRTLIGALGQECVDWAAVLLEDGHDGRSLRILAGLTPPLNAFEVAERRDAALTELGFIPLDGGDPVRDYAREILHDGLNGNISMSTALALVSELCIADHHRGDLTDFYLLHYAEADLREAEIQFYWNGATRANIASIIREKALAFVAVTSRS